jgi:hypothetical protein
MDFLTISIIEKIMLIITYLLGFITIILGIAILVHGVWGRDLRTLASQTTRLAQNGLAEEVSGLVGNASALLTTINEMVRTSTGIGLYLTLIGIILIGIAFYVTITFFI